MKTAEDNERRAIISRPAFAAQVGRIPILDATLDVVAYELVFRDGEAEPDALICGDFAAAKVFWNAFIEMGLETVTECKHALVHVTPTFVEAGCCRIFEPRDTALVVTAEHASDFKAALRLADLAALGFGIVVEGLAPGGAVPGVRPIELLKVDVRGMSPQHLRSTVEAARENAAHVMAAGIETRALFEAARAAGFTRFQGRFLFEPEIMAVKSLPADAVARLRLLNVLNQPEIDTDELERVIAQDLPLSYRLLRYLNSSLFSFSCKVESIRHALLLLGPKWVKAWANLVVLAGFSGANDAIFATAMTRARHAELMAARAGDVRTDVPHTAGLFSLLGVFLHCSLPDALALLSLSQELQAALLAYEGRVGEILRCVLEYESGQVGEARCLGLDGAAVSEAYVEALRWTSEVRGAL